VRHLAWLSVVAIAALIDGLLAGASLDQSIEQLPARHRIGVRAYSAYSRASHLANGRFWLVPLGLGGAAITVVAAIWAAALDLPRDRALPIFIAGALAAGHALVNLRAVPINLSQWRVGGDDAALASVLRRFARWQGVRATLQGLTFAATVWALTVNAWPTA